MVIRFALGSALVLMASMAFAATPKSNVTQADSDNYYLNWQERNGEIALDSVCSKNEKGSTQFRNCQRHAQVMFRNHCKQSNDKSSKWCVAQSRYNP
ncbi:hypothetical protein [Metapseudomonas boanensis]|uniref:Uncharacterized protein n=1 Tax=Metapseudomonas boanensis TaxID=2822138 RepID=A0ABS5XCN7_9GAMM|nr:hypothetical protein [Pseudomonas boanensis]MBT8765462.1 hypothetical protein [Pseudomonas boanensis]